VIEKRSRDRRFTFDRFVVSPLLDNIGYLSNFEETRVLVFPPLLEVVELREGTSSSSYFVPEFEQLFGDMRCDES